MPWLISKGISTKIENVINWSIDQQRILYIDKYMLWPQGLEFLHKSVSSLVNEWKYMISVNNLCFGGRSTNKVLEYHYNAAKICLYWSSS